MWVIRGSRGELLHKSQKPILDARARDEPDSSEAITPGVVWKRVVNGAVEDICDHYPNHPDAQPTTKDDPELVAYWAASHPLPARNFLAELDQLKAVLVQKSVVTAEEIDSTKLQAEKL